MSWRIKNILYMGSGRAPTPHIYASLALYNAPILHTNDAVCALSNL
jgi:hypothetical protein